MAAKIPMTGTRIATVDMAPSPAPTPIRALVPADLRELHASLRHAEETVTTQAARLRTKLRECRPTPDEQEQALRTFLSQAEPGYELRQLVSHTQGMWSAYQSFDAALAEARRVREQAQALTARLKAELTQIQETDVVQLEHREAMHRALGPVGYVATNLAVLLDGVRALESVARQSVTRLVHAAGVVGREWEVEQLTVRLNRVHQVVQTIRGSSPDNDRDRLGTLVSEVAEQCQMSMPIPRIEWPSPDPFVPPKLIRD